MYWKSWPLFIVKNYINIDLSFLIDLASHVEFLKLFYSLTQKGKKEYLKLSVK